MPADNDGMVGTYAAISLLVVLAFSLLIMRTGTIALVMTGLSRDRASFQSVSAFSGVGFTTKEAEDVMSSAARRRIIRTLIILGNIGIITGIATLVLSFSGEGNGSGIFRFAYLVVGTSSLVILARSQWFERLVTPVITWGLNRATSLDPYDYKQLLRLGDGYSIAEIEVGQDDWMANRDLSELDLNAEDVLALGILRDDGSYLGAPAGNRTIEPGNTILVYGRRASLQELSNLEQTDSSFDA